jgi:hypothetical protein
MHFYTFQVGNLESKHENLMENESYCLLPPIHGRAKLSSSGRTIKWESLYRRNGSCSFLFYLACNVYRGSQIQINSSSEGGCLLSCCAV